MGAVETTIREKASELISQPSEDRSEGTKTEKVRFVVPQSNDRELDTIDGPQTEDLTRNRDPSDDTNKEDKNLASAPAPTSLAPAAANSAASAENSATKSVAASAENSASKPAAASAGNSATKSVAASAENSASKPIAASAENSATKSVAASAGNSASKSIAASAENSTTKSVAASDGNSASKQTTASANTTDSESATSIVKRASLVGRLLSRSPKPEAKAAAKPASSSTARSSTSQKPMSKARSSIWQNIVDGSLLGTKLFTHAAVYDQVSGELLACSSKDFAVTKEEAIHLAKATHQPGRLAATGIVVAGQEFSYSHGELGTALYGSDPNSKYRGIVIEAGDVYMIVAIFEENGETAKKNLKEMISHFKEHYNF